ncbi:hypothetical protein AAY473_033274 [Plecturocebus cupreus]
MQRIENTGQNLTPTGLHQMSNSETNAQKRTDISPHTESRSISPTEIQWYNLNSLQLQTPRLKRSSHLSLPRSRFVAQAVLASSEPPALGFQRAKIIGPRLECSGVISAHCNLRLPGSSNSLLQPPELLGLQVPVEMVVHHLGQVGLELLTSWAWASQSAGITDVSHRARLIFFRLKKEKRL